MAGVTVVANSAFNYFTPPVVQHSIETTRELKIPPTNALAQDAPIEFNVMGSDADYSFLDPSDGYFHFIVQVQKTAGGNPEAADKVSCCQNFMHSCFTRIEVYLNDRAVNDHHSYYNCTSYIQDYLTWSADIKKYRLSLEGWIGDDTPGTFDKIDTVAGKENPVLKTRHEALGLGQVVDFIMRPRIEILNSLHFIPPKVNLKIRFIPASPQFVLTRAADKPDPRVVIKDANWFLPVRQATHSQMMAIVEAVRDPKLGLMRIPLNRTTCRAFQLAGGVTVGNIQNINSGPHPNKIIIAMAPSAYLNGSYALNPFNFGNQNITNIVLRKDTTSVPTQEYRPTFTGAKKQYKRELFCLLRGLNMHKGNEIIPLEQDAFEKSSCFWIFDLTPDNNSATSYSPLGSGHIHLETTFSEGLAAATTVLVIAQFDSWITIDEIGTVKTSWG